MIRVRPRAGWGKKKEFVKITPEGLTVEIVEGEITERVLTPPDGLAAEAPKVPLDDIRRVFRSRVGTFSESSLWTRYTVETPRGNSEFRVCDRDAANVDRALTHLLRDRFDPHILRRSSGTERSILGAVIVACACVVLSWVSWIFTVVGLVIGVAAGFVALCLWGSKKSSQAKVPVPAKRRKLGRAGRKPFRSQPLGWLLKLLGLAWIILVFQSSALDEMMEKIQEKNHNYQAQQYIQWLIYAPGIGMLWLGYRMCLRTFEPYRHADPRPPIVYLRGFDDDGHGTFQPTNLLAKVHGIESFGGGEGPDAGSGVRKKFQVPFWFVHPVKLLRMFLNADRHSAEELLAAAFRRCGPFIAIGQPGERLATPGADRMYVAHEKWQGVVLDYLDRCQAVVLQPSQSEGIRWEVQQVFERIPRHRILLSLLNFRNRPGDYEDFRVWLEEQAGVKLPLSVPILDEPCFVYFEADGTPRLQRLCFSSPLRWSFTCNAVDADRTFHTFIQGLSGGPRELPCAPKKHPVHAAASLLIPGTCVLGLIFYGYLQYFGRLAVDIARDKIAAVVPALPGVGALDNTPPIVWRGKKLDYEFRLGKDFQPEPIPDGAPAGEYLFSYRGGLGKFGADVYDVEFDDDDKTAEVLRQRIETGLRTRNAETKVTLVDKKVETVEGTRWLRLTFEQEYGPGLKETKQVRIYHSWGQTLMVSIVLPSFEHYDRLADQVLATLRITETPEDRLLREAREGKPIEYNGRGMKYTVALPPIWKATDQEKKSAEGVIEAAKKVGTSVVLPEYDFALRESKIATLGIEVQDEELDLDFLDEIAENQLQNYRKLFAGMFPGETPTFRIVDRHKVRSGEREWGEIEIRVEFPSQKKGLNELVRMSSYKGKSLCLGVTILNDCPAVRKLAGEALDSARILPAPLPDGYEESWTGKIIIVSRPEIHYKQPAAEGKTPEWGALQSLRYSVLADQDGKLLVEDEGQKAWFDKDDAVLPEKGVDYFTGRLRANPNELHALFGRAESWLLAGKLDNAIRDLTEAIRLHPENASAYYNRGFVRRDKQDVSGALKDFTESARLNPEDADAFHYRGEARRILGDYDHAIEDFNEALRLKPRDADVLNELGICWWDKKDYDKAIAAYDEAIRARPDYARAYFNRGLSREAKGETDSALKDFSETIRIDPKFAKAYYERGWVWRSRLNYKAALPDFSEAARLNPRNSNAFRYRGEAQRLLGNSQSALEDYTEALRLKPKDADILGERGIVWYSLEEYDRAIEDLNASIGLRPNDAFRYRNRGLAWARKEEFDKAIDDYNEALRLSPGFSLALQNRATAWSDKKDYDKAIADLTEAIRLDPKNSFIPLSRGDVFKRKKDFEKALQDYEAAVRLDPENSQALDAQAWLLAVCPLEQFRAGKKAVELAKRACKLNDWERPEHLATLAAACAEAGDFDEAVEWQEKALKDQDYAAAFGKEARERLQQYKAEKPYHEE